MGRVKVFVFKEKTGYGEGVRLGGSEKGKRFRVADCVVLSNF